ncbi:TPA: RNA-directed DNA polymerase [Providencia stuartii]|nr:RNA-directed DNA polymerase [Providencia stuartii]
MEILQQLLKKGFFPIQLPPCFESLSWADKFETINNELDKTSKEKPGRYNPLSQWTKIIKYSVARSSFYRRTTSILNPVSYFILAREISNNWNEIYEHYEKSKISLSKPSFDFHGVRAISLTKFSSLYDEKIIKSSGYKYALITDISTYFPSIYTHSIPWAFDNKLNSKKRMHDKKWLPNKLDLYCRNLQDGQTVGLPIGPDTSHIISEIIGTSIDIQLKDALNGWPKGFRYVDDFYLFFESRNAAEKALAALVRIVGDFELQINAAKTKIIESKELVEESWRYSIKKLKISHEINKQKNDIHDYFSSTFNLESKYKDESIAKYALKQLSSNIIKKKNWDIFESYLFKIGYSFPNTIELISRFLITYQKNGYDINKSNVKIFCFNMLTEHSNSDHHNEVCWLLWLCKEFKIKITKPVFDSIESINNDICNLILLDMQNNNLLTTNTSFSQEKLNKYATKEALNGSDWLISYESGKRNWLGNKSIDFIEAHPIFNLFLKENIYFYKAESSSPLFFKPRVNNENQSIDLFSTDLDIRNDFEFDELDEEYFDNTDDDENEFEESEF